MFNENYARMNQRQFGDPFETFFRLISGNYEKTTRKGEESNETVPYPYSPGSKGQFLPPRQKKSALAFFPEHFRNVTEIPFPELWWCVFDAMFESFGPWEK